MPDPSHNGVAVITRINVVGVSRSGKSTFAKRLSELSGIPLVEMDAVFWKPYWGVPSDEEFFGKLSTAIAGDQWILDGNYSRTTPIKWSRVQLVIWIDYSFPQTLWQSVSRTWRRGWSKEELWPGTGNRESLTKSFFSKQSVIWWSITSRARARQRYFAAMRDPECSHIEFVRLTSRVEADRYLTELGVPSKRREAAD